MDFQEGEKLFGDAVRVGNKYIIGKGQTVLYLIKILNRFINIYIKQIILRITDP